jgi:hypothetical protein
MEETMDGARSITRRCGILIVVASMLVALAVGEVVASPRTPGGEPEAPWVGPIRTVDRSLAAGRLGAATRALHAAYLAALSSCCWEGMVAYGDAALRVGDASGPRQPWIEKARQAYLMALLRARTAGSLEGVLRAAQAFQNLRDGEVVALALRIADRVAHAQAGGALTAGRSGRLDVARSARTPNPDCSPEP